MKQKWIEKAVRTHNYHSDKLKHNSSWKLIDTAIALGLSIGATSQNILIAKWLKTHERQIRSFKYAKDALEFIRAKQKQINSTSIHLE